MTPSDTYEGLRFDFPSPCYKNAWKKERNQESSLVFLTMTRISLVFWSSYFKSWPSNQRGTGWSGSIMTPHDKHIHPRESNFPTPGLTCAQMWMMVYCRVSPRTLVWSWKFQDFIGSFEASTGCPERWPALDKRGDRSDSETGVAHHCPLTCLNLLELCCANVLWQIWFCRSFQALNYLVEP